MPTRAVEDRNQVLPAELTSRNQWCVWKLHNGSKIPTHPSGTVFRSNDETTWVSFDEVASRERIAWTFSSDDPYCGIDLDGCIIDSQWTPWAEEVMDRFRGVAYAEISPSETGVKLTTKAAKPNYARCVHAFGGPKEQLECYDSGRFWTMTGSVVPGFETIGDGQLVVDWLCQKYLTQSRATDTTTVTTATECRPDLWARAMAYMLKVSPVREGGRNREAFSLAGNLASIDENGARLNEDQILQLVATWNMGNSPPLSPEELRKCVHNGLVNGTPRPAKISIALDKTSTTPGIKGVLSKNLQKRIPVLNNFAPFPTDQLPPVLRDFVTQGASSMSCDQSFVAMPLLAGLASAIGNSHGLLIKRGWVVPSIIWSVVVAESGSGKSAPQRLAIRPIHEMQRKLTKRFEAEYSEFEKLNEIYMRDLAEFRKSKSNLAEPPQQPVAPVCSRVVVNDTTIEALGKRLADNPRGVLCAADELSGWFGSFNKYSRGGKGGDESKWLEFFDAQTSVIDRASSKKPIVIDQASVSITGTIQPAILRKQLTSEHKTSGLAARLLFAMPPRMQRSWTEQEVDESVEDRVVEIFEKLFALEMRYDEDERPQTNLIRLTSDAKALFVKYYNRHNKEQQALTGDLYAAYSKLEAYAARLALVIHCVRYASGETNLSELDVNSMTSGIVLCEWFKAEAKRVYAVLSESEDQNEARQQLQWIAAQGNETTARDFYRAHRSQFPAIEDAERQLIKFTENELGDWLDQPPSSVGGRPTRTFKLTDFGQNPQNTWEKEGFVQDPPESLPPGATLWEPDE